MSDLPPSSTSSGGQGVGSVEVVTALEGQQGIPGEGQVGEIFDVTVTAKQSYGGESTAGHPLVNGNDMNKPNIQSSIPPPPPPKAKPQSIGVGTVGAPVPLLPQPPGKTLFNSNTPVRPLSTSLSIHGGGGGGDKAVISPVAS